MEGHIVEVMFYFVLMSLQLTDDIIIYSESAASGRFRRISFSAEENEDSLC
jgi:hypothetical protein